MDFSIPGLRHCTAQEAKPKLKFDHLNVSARICWQCSSTDEHTSGLKSVTGSPLPRTRPGSHLSSTPRLSRTSRRYIAARVAPEALQVL